MSIHNSIYLSAMQILILQLLTAFALTQFLEWLLFALLTKVAWGRAFVFMLNVNAITWPVLQVFYSLGDINIYILELGVVLAETLLMWLWWKWGWVKCFFIALVINAVSYFIGTYIYECLFQL